MAAKIAIAGREAVGRHRRRAAGAPPGRAGDRHGRDGARRRPRRPACPVDLEGPQAAGVRAGGDHDRVRAGIGGREEAGAAGQAGAGESAARQGRRDGRRRPPRPARPGRRAPASPAARLRRRRLEAPPRLAGDQLLQPPVAADAVRPRRTIPAFTHGHRQGEGSSPRTRRRTRRPASKAKEAQDAALPPTDDVAGQAKAAKVDTMDAQQAGHVRQEGVHRRGEGRDRGEVAEDAEGGRRLQGVGQGRRGQGRGQGPGHRRARRARPRTSRPPPRRRRTSPRRCPSRSRRWAPEQPGAAPCDPGRRRRARSRRRPSSSTSRPASSRRTRSWPTPRSPSSSWPQSNEPEFQQALADKQAAAAHADTAPGGVPPAGAAGHRSRARPTRRRDRRRRRRDAGLQGRGAGAGWSRTRARRRPRTRPSAPRSPTKIAGDLRRDRGRREEDPRRHRPARWRRRSTPARPRRGRRSRAYVAAKMSAYKKDRYGGWLGGLRWAKDKLLGMPDKVNEFYEAGRELYLKQMDGVISRVADIVGGDLDGGEAADRDRQDRDRDLREEPARATCRRSAPRRRAEIGEQFDQLESDVDAKQDAAGRHPGHEVRRGPQGARRADRGAAGREQGPGRQGDRRDQGRHQHDPRARRDAQGRAGPGGRRRRRHHQEPDRLPRQPDRRRSRAASSSSRTTSSTTSARA